MKNSISCLNSLNAKVAIIRISQLIHSANQLTDFYIMTTLGFNELSFYQLRFAEDKTLKT